MNVWSLYARKCNCVIDFLIMGTQVNIKSIDGKNGNQQKEDVT